MTSLKTAITVRPMERKDVSDCATIADAAFRTDELFVRLYPRYKEYPNELRDWWLVRLKGRLVDPITVPLVAEASIGDGPDAEKEIVGFAVWLRLGTDAGALERMAKDTYLHKLERYLLSWNLSYVTFFDHTDRTALAKFHSTSYEIFNKLDPTGYWYLVNLGVAPQHQRRGIGSALVSWGVAEAKKDKLPVGLIASIKGRSMYVKHGFRIVERKKVWEDMEDGVAMILDGSRD